MPLVQSSSAAALAENIRRLKAEGYTNEQAVAIAKSIQVRARSRARTDENPRARRTAQILATSQLVRKRLKRQRTRRLPRQVAPRGIEREYAKVLLAVVARTKELLRPVLEALPQLLASAAADRKHLDAGEGTRIHTMIDEVRQQLRSNLRPGTTMLEGIAQRVSAQNKEQLHRQIRAALGADVFMSDAALRSVIEGFVAENLSLYTDLPAQLIREIDKAATRAVSSGTLHKDLAKEIEERFSVARNRAKLIARDQVGKLYGQVNATRQQSLGITHFIWRTSGDERVRDDHQEREGERYSYEDPPDGELPGQPIQCRCYAEPVFDEILAAR